MFSSFSFCNNHPKGSIPRSHPAMVSRFSGVRNPLCCSISCLPRPATRAPQPAKPSLLSPAARLSSAKRPFYPRAGKDKALLPDTMQVPGPISAPGTLSSCRGRPQKLSQVPSHCSPTTDPAFWTLQAADSSSWVAGEHAQVENTRGQRSQLTRRQRRCLCYDL